MGLFALLYHVPETHKTTIKGGVFVNHLSISRIRPSLATTLSVPVVRPQLNAVCTSVVRTMCYCKARGLVRSYLFKTEFSSYWRLVPGHFMRIPQLGAEKQVGLNVLIGALSPYE
jgi:hypothetical protein